MHVVVMFVETVLLILKFHLLKVLVLIPILYYIIRNILLNYFLLLSSNIKYKVQILDKKSFPVDEQET